MSEQEQMMELIEQQQTELEEKDKMIAKLKTDLKNLTGEMQLMNEQIVKMSESDKELQESKKLKEQTEREKEWNEIRKSENEKREREQKKRDQELQAKATAIQDKEKNIDNTIQEKKEELEKQNKIKLKEDRDKAIIKNYAFTFGLVYYSIATTIIIFYLTYTPFHLQKIKNFFLTIFTAAKKIIYDIPIMLWNIQLEIDNKYLSIALRVIFILVFLAIIVLIIRFIVIKIKDNIEYLHGQYYNSYYSKPQYKSEPFRVCLFVCLIEYMLLFTFANYVPINFNYIFVILAVLSIFLINKAYLSNLD